METLTINLIVPRGWHELDDKQLRYLYSLLADDYTSAEIRTLCLVRFARLGGTSPKPKKSSFWSRFAPKVRWSGLKVLYRHNSDTAKLFSPPKFIKLKANKGYWF